MARLLLSARDLAVARHALGDGDDTGLLDKHADIYRADPITAQMPPVGSPTYANVPMSVEMINRLPSPAITVPDAPHVTIRFECRFVFGFDVRPEDEFIVTDEVPSLRYRVVGVRTPADYAVFEFADAELH